MTSKNLKINPERLLNRIEVLAGIGSTPEGGSRRLALSDEDKLGRDLVVTWMKELSLKIEIDKIGNIFGTRSGKTEASPVMTGSHIDTVYNGGKLDGNLGVLAGLEIVNSLNDDNIETDRPFTVAVFTNEEGARFQPDMMGSLVYAGGLELDTALAVKDDKGKVLGEELSRIGYAGEKDCGFLIPHAFIELHIEQGPVLENEGVTIGVVENLQGISWTEVIISGQANHAGTTPMRLRIDAGYCASMLATFVHDLALEIGEPQVGTIGVIELKPNIINVVPGSARVTIDLRNPDNKILIQAEKKLEKFLSGLESQQKVTIETTRLVRFQPVTFDKSIIDRIENAAKSSGYSCRKMTSGAGHDAQMMSRVCPTAMIFTPSIRGVSHNPAEATKPEDIIAGTEVLLRTVVGLLEEQVLTS